MGNLANQELLVLLFPLLFLYLIIKAVIRLFSELGKSKRYGEAQVRLLMHIAAKQGVDPDKIAEIVAEADLPSFKQN